MRIVLIEIENFRGIKSLHWTPSKGVNCLIGPGDSTKTTILDAIEFCLNRRFYICADDCDFFDLDVKKPIRITVTLASLPPEFKADDLYGLYLGGFAYPREKVQSITSNQLENDPLPLPSVFIENMHVVDVKIDAIVPRRHDRKSSEGFLVAW
jgi:putative ATP-dependent endonuclease of OLD family